MAVLSLRVSSENSFLWHSARLAEASQVQETYLFAKLSKTDKLTVDQDEWRREIQFKDICSSTATRMWSSNCYWYKMCYEIVERKIIIYLVVNITTNRYR